MAIDNTPQLTRYKPHFPKAYNRYGSQMGRADVQGDPDYAYRVHLTRVRLDAGGYDVGGAYWGHSPGRALFLAESKPDDDVQILRKYLRERTRDDAKARIREYYVHATFYR